MMLSNQLAHRSAYFRAILCCCCVLFSSASAYAQSPPLIASWLEVKQEGETRILGVARLSPTGEAVFEPAIRTKPVRINPKIDDTVSGVEKFKNGGKAFVPVILFGDYKLEKDAPENRRFVYRPATFHATNIQILNPEETTKAASESFRNPIQREDYLRRLVPLQLNNAAVYVDNLSLKTERVAAGRNRTQLYTLTLTIKNLSTLPKDFELGLPTLELSDSQGVVEITELSKLTKKDPDYQRYHCRLKRQPAGKVSVKITVADQDGSEKSLKCEIPQPKRRGLPPRRFPVPGRKPGKPITT